MDGTMLLWVVVVVAWGFGLAWIANTAASRGRSQVGWTCLAVIISIAAVVLSELPLLHFILTDRDRAEVLGLALSFVPYVLVFFSLLGLGIWLRRRPVKVRMPRAWPVSCGSKGSAQLEITVDAVRLTWGDHTQVIPHAELRSVAQDGECLRIAWTDGELLLLPMLPPQTRDGRIEQSRTLARLLAPPPARATAVKLPKQRRPG